MPEVETKALDKIDINTELKELSPLEKRSIELKAEAEAIEITDKETYTEAKKVRRELVSHRNGVRDMRKTFTRKLDELKSRFMQKEDEVLVASISGEEIIKDKIAVYEKAERERKEAEEKRIQEIVDKFQKPELDRKTATLEDIKRARAAIKMERGLLEQNDRNRKAVKDQIIIVNAYLDETEQFIIDRDEQARVAEEQRLEQERIDKEKRELEQQRMAQEMPKTETLEPTDTSVKDAGSNPTPPPSETVLEPTEKEIEMGQASVGLVEQEIKRRLTVARDALQSAAEAMDKHPSDVMQSQGRSTDSFADTLTVVIQKIDDGAYSN